MTSKLKEVRTELVTMDAAPVPTAVAGIRELRDTLPAAVRMVAERRARIAICRHGLPVASVVPMSDYFFVTELQRRLWEAGYLGGRQVIEARDVAERIIEIREGLQELEAKRWGYEPRRWLTRTWPGSPDAVPQMRLSLALQSWRQWRGAVWQWEHDRTIHGIRWE